MTQYSLVLVDASGYLFRAYHALPKLTNSRGEPTGAVIGVINMLRKLISQQQPDYLGIIFDASGPTFRDELYPAYKAQRSPIEDELRAQFDPLCAIIQAQGWPLLIESGVEADDVIATLATQAAAAGISTLIATSDKDLAQLVCQQITLVDTMSDTWLDRAGVIAKFGVPPERIVDYLTLVGDSSDNIPGVPKCGPKTAVKWLTEYGDLEGIIAHATAIKGKVGESLRAHLEQLAPMRQLVTVKRDLVLTHSPVDLRPQPPNQASLRNWYERLEARRLIASLDSPPAEPTATTPCILTEDDLAAWCERLRTAGHFSLHVQTADDTQHSPLIGLALAIAPGQAVYVPLTQAFDAPPPLDANTVLAAFKPLLEDPKLIKSAHDLKVLWHVLAQHEITLCGEQHDTMLASYVLNSTAHSHQLADLASRYLELATPPQRLSDLLGKGSSQRSFDQIALAQAAAYAAEQADFCLRLQKILWSRLEQTPALTALYRELELPLIAVLARMERTGVRIDSAELALQSEEFATRLDVLEQEAHRVAGRSFNLGSPQQIREIFFTEQQLPVIAKTPKGVPSTSEAVLIKLAEAGHALPQLILAHRGLAKLRSTYTEKLPRLVNSHTQRLHTSYHQAVTATGRLSCSDPNLQNIPIRSDDGRRIRQAFIPAEGWRMVAADYSQIELRLMAHLSRDARLLAAFADGQDIHRATAAEIHGLPLDQVTTNQRRAAKAINFGLMYGMSAFGLARQLGIKQAEAEDYVARYFARYPGVQSFMDQVRRQARGDGYVETLLGRRLYLPDISHSNHQRRTAAERTAINAPLQGSAADIIKRAMLTVDHWIAIEQPPVRLLMQVHDELVFEIEPSAVEAASLAIREAMTSAAELAVPLVVDIGVGENWDEAH